MNTTCACVRPNGEHYPEAALLCDACLENDIEQDLPLARSIKLISDISFVSHCHYRVQEGSKHFTDEPQNHMENLLCHLSRCIRLTTFDFHNLSGSLGTDSAGVTAQMGQYFTTRSLATKMIFGLMPALPSPTP